MQALFIHQNEKKMLYTGDIDVGVQHMSFEEETE